MGWWWHCLCPRMLTSHALVCRYHPDKNRNNPGAADQFLLVAKAHEALTDPVAKENYAKYGNPDGRQSLKVIINYSTQCSVARSHPVFVHNPQNGIGLPSFLQDESKSSQIVLLYLGGLVAVAVIAILWYHKLCTVTKTWNGDLTLIVVLLAGKTGVVSKVAEPLSPRSSASGSSSLSRKLCYGPYMNDRTAHAAWKLTHITTVPCSKFVDIVPLAEELLTIQAPHDPRAVS